LGERHPNESWVQERFVDSGHQQALVIVSRHIAAAVVAAAAVVDPCHCHCIE